jgi:hypothetical protein
MLEDKIDVADYYVNFIESQKYSDGRSKVEENEE